MADRKKALVVGSGIGGLTTAARLAQEGRLDVEVVERMSFREVGSPNTTTMGSQYPPVRCIWCLTDARGQWLNFCSTSVPKVVWTSNGMDSISCAQVVMRAG